MIEFVVVMALVGVAAVLVDRSRRQALRRARLRAEGVLDELAASACSALADGHSRRSAKALDRYERVGAEVAAATTRRELDRVVNRHRRRQWAYGVATRGLVRVRDTIAEAVPARR
ncbi:MAG: hypothetical protein AB7V62_07290 [Thermoleophilia bacterium]